ncbi:MAG: (Fe-S)-binding protein, partial [Candidatus Kapaibacteriota bacterium]
MSTKFKPNELLQTINLKPKYKNWMEVPVEYRKGTFNYAGSEEALIYLDQPNPRKWQPTDLDWKLPENWQEIILDGLRERLEKYRSLKIFMDICVRCGACAD